MNKIFVLEGTDGSGKKTQAQKLCERLLSENIECYTTSFPNYNSQSSGPVKEYLGGNISLNPNDISPKAASTFYAVDRYITFNESIKKYYEDNKSIILLDRYVTSNILHQGGKILNKTNDYSKLDEFITWNENLEYNDLELPRATVTFFLYIPVEFTLKLIKNRKNEITNEAKKDIHESDSEHLRNASKSGIYTAKKLGWKIIECVKDGKLRSIDDIHEEIYNIVKSSI